MYRKVLVAASVVALVSAPAFAATQYWVEKDSTTKKCSVVSTKPDGKKMIDAGTKAYASQANAEKALKMLKDCK
ncbi:hypothetical protein SAMN03159463_02589 [Mesorhizobium sp. NFR06]|uniref:hypothetical protein n=1 Tax=Mesorhizobium sp. NFR06 TaxID=1566290 RepID=UPI0008E30D6B|nr:hypothetical protein [Mesorhizobium sp. NFR06]SFO66672.1 hypothetical protein SAMN03159463_02589 [Mesorhizobium sp. NFR06]